MANNPVERQWFVVRVAAKPVPQVTIAFEQFLRDMGQLEIDKLLPPNWLAAAPRKRVRAWHPPSAAPPGTDNSVPGRPGPGTCPMMRAPCTNRPTPPKQAARD